MNQNKSKKVVFGLGAPIYRAFSGGNKSGQKGMAHEEGVAKLIKNSGGTATYISSPANPMEKVVACKPSFVDAKSMYENKMARSIKQSQPQLGALKGKQSSK